MSFRSEIRRSEINDLLEKSAKRSFGKYLATLTLKKVRGFQNQAVTFDFPVTALIGTNGGGKTTVLGAAACVYTATRPKSFFAKSGKYDESMKGWSIEYELIDRSINAKEGIKRTASFTKSKWSRDAVPRPVLFFGVLRTVPAHERKELIKCATGKFSVPDSQVENLTAEATDAISRILGKDVSGFRQLRIENGGKSTLLTGKTKANETYSEFHFGVGESSVIRMVVAIEGAEPNTLVLIEEIENGLHPVAAVKMVEYLIAVASRKNVQTIFTTHSNDALAPLPSKAIWVATQDRIFQGKLDIHSLRAITGQVEAQLVIFVEDSFAKTWVEAMLRNYGSVALDHVEVHAMQGDGTAVAVNLSHNQDPSIAKPSVCIVDGDSQQATSDANKTFRLPGQTPESHVFDSVLDKWTEFGGILTAAIYQRFEDTARVKQICEEVCLSNMDRHLLFAQIGRRVGLIPGETVSAAFANVYAQSHPTEVKHLFSAIDNLLPKEGASGTFTVGSISVPS